MVHFTRNVSRPTGRQDCADLWHDSANILIFPLAYLPILNKFSILLCTLGLGVDLILYEEQRKLDGTGATTGVSTLTTLPQSRN
jgi:hypothetical protein